MTANIVNVDDVYVLNHCTRFLARAVHDPRHNFGQFAPDDGRAGVCEAWRFPIVDSYFDGVSREDSYGYNTVTFVYDGTAGASPSVEVVGTFGDLFDPLPLEPVRFLGEHTGYLALALRVPKGRVYRYKFAVDGQWMVDPVNPQQEREDNGELWSRFFTDACQVPLVLSRRERDVLGRLVAHLLPFRIPENRAFVKHLYEKLDRHSREQQFPLAYRLDEEVGVVNYIDKLLARAEQHHADDYHTCLRLIDVLLRTRYGGLDPLMLGQDVYKDLYQEMDSKDEEMEDWDHDRYGSPRFFLLLLRRHAMTGAFTHPKSGGNSGAAGWAYLESRFRDENDQTLFDWRRAIEAPLGRNTDYRG